MKAGGRDAGTQVVVWWQRWLEEQNKEEGPEYVCWHCWLDVLQVYVTGSVSIPPENHAQPHQGTSETHMQKEQHKKATKRSWQC